MIECERLWCDEPAVWRYTYDMGSTVHWCHHHTLYRDGYRWRVEVHASSPQLTLEEVAHV